tara:strand:- start:83 stop:907 length:825 start_codon:yes stop_codon:yes gene_type:complete
MVLIYNFKKRFLNKIKLLLFERFEYKQEEIIDQVIPKNKKIIPNIVYQSWVSRSIQRQLSQEIKKFRNLNKDFSFLTYTNEERDQYMKKYWGDHEIYEIYLNSVFQPSKADIWRYCILFERGGFYFDIKSGYNGKLSKLSNSYGAILSYEPFLTQILPEKEYFYKVEDFNILLNWGFGFKKNHKLLEMLINNICKYSSYFRNKKFQNPKAAILAFTGPGMLSKTYREYISNDNKIIKINGINFYGKGVFEMKGAKYRFKKNRSYGDFKNSIILS